MPPEIELLTPYSFTGVDYLGGSLLRLDRFGEKGVFDWKTGNYPVPLWYESVALEGERLTVKRMGQTGQLDLNGNWLTALHN